MFGPGRLYFVAQSVEILANEKSIKLFFTSKVFSVKKYEYVTVGRKREYYYCLYRRYTDELLMWRNKCIIIKAIV